MGIFWIWLGVGFEEGGERRPVIIGVFFLAGVEECGRGEGVGCGRRIGLGRGWWRLGGRDGVDGCREFCGEIAEKDGGVFDVGVRVEGAGSGEDGCGV